MPKTVPILEPKVLHPGSLLVPDKQAVGHRSYEVKEDIPSG